MHAFHDASLCRCSVNGSRVTHSYRAFCQPVDNNTPRDVTPRCRIPSTTPAVRGDFGRNQRYLTTCFTRPPLPTLRRFPTYNLLATPAAPSISSVVILRPPTLPRGADTTCGARSGVLRFFTAVDVDGRWIAVLACLPHPYTDVTMTYGRWRFGHYRFIATPVGRRS